MLGLSEEELKIFTISCFTLTSALFIINGVIYARRGDNTESSTQIGLGIMFFLVGLTQNLILH
jgi:predicted Na+-dependent transporter